MIKKLKLLIIIIFINTSFISINAHGDTENIVEILEIIQKDLKTLEKAVYSNSSNGESTLSDITMDQNAEEVLTRHLLKLSEIENQFQ